MRLVGAVVLLASMASPACAVELGSPADVDVRGSRSAPAPGRKRARQAAATASSGHAIVPPGAAPPATDPALRYGPDGIYAAIPSVDDRGRDQVAMFRAWNPDPIGNEDGNLASVRPELAALVRRARADNPDLRFVVGSGRRGEAEQRLAEAWGWSPPIGRATRSSHLRSHIDGRAVDLWPLDEAGRVTFAAGPMSRLGAAVTASARRLAIPISWGGHWRGRKDPAHFELLR